MLYLVFLIKYDILNILCMRLFANARVPMDGEQYGETSAHHYVRNKLLLSCILEEHLARWESVCTTIYFYTIRRFRCSHKFANEFKYGVTPYGSHIAHLIAVSLRANADNLHMKLAHDNSAFKVHIYDCAWMCGDKISASDGNAIGINVWRKFARGERPADTVHFIACLNFWYSPLCVGLFRKVHGNWLAQNGNAITK